MHPQIVLSVAVRLGPDPGEELPMCQCSTRVGREDPQQIPFDWRQVEERPVPGDRSPGQVDDQTIRVDGGVRSTGLSHRRAPQRGADARLQLGRAERLGDVVVSAGIEESHLFVVIVTGGQHHDGRGGPATDITAHVDSGLIGKSEIKDNEVDARRRGQVEAFARRRGLDDPGNDFFQGMPDDTANLPLIVDDENRGVVHGE